MYANTLKVSELARLEKIQYQAAKLVTGTLHCNNENKLYVELGWESIKLISLDFAFFKKSTFNGQGHWLESVCQKWIG